MSSGWVEETSPPAAAGLVTSTLNLKCFAADQLPAGSLPATCTQCEPSARSFAVTVVPVSVTVVPGAVVAD